jgi:hypothetical protein
MKNGQDRLNRGEAREFGSFPSEQPLNKETSAPTADDLISEARQARSPSALWQAAAVEKFIPRPHTPSKSIRRRRLADTFPA